MTTEPSVALEAQVSRTLDADFATDAAWLELLAEAQPATIFQHPAWLAAWRASVGRSANLVLVRVFADTGRLVAAAAFQVDGRILTFAAADSVDYADVLIAGSLNEHSAAGALELLLRSALAAVPGCTGFRLTRVPADSRMLTLLPRTGLRVDRQDDVVAPRMDMAEVEDRLKKKSLVRHERGLQKLGELTAVTHRDTDAVLGRLDEFFDQHVARWADTPYPSLFQDPARREFYRELARALGPPGLLRHTEIRLDGALVAAHFGFLFAGCFTWYKPSFDPALARKSPGEVLLKRLLELARDEHATLFDFTIGDESFKERFATAAPRVVRVRITGSWLRYRIWQARSRVGAWLRTLRGH